IAKGYAVDLAFESVKKLNLKGGIINLGGNIRTFPSSPPGRKNYSIGIRDPFDKNKIMGGTVKILNSSIATSGDYERFVIIKGERFTHIINPLTGYPVKGMAAVTVICKSALWADAISTSVFLNGKHFAKKIHENYPGVDMLIIQGYKNLPQTISINTYGRIWKQINNILPEYKDKEKK
ncbi:MAG: FAD:protein FMN transferase, partial [Victivallales bacterium]|nr:FAD:protein FMN transferase [Victivallales bacterium]